MPSQSKKKLSARYAVSALSISRAAETKELTGTRAQVEAVVQRFFALGVVVPIGPDAYEYQRTASVTVRRLD
jgi:hypothetical protein